MKDFEKIIEEAKAGVLPYESWEQLAGETGAAFTAFCCYRDYGPERNIRKAVEASERGSGNALLISKKYRLWRQWSMKYQWVKRAGDYDKYLEKLKQGELRKTIEAQGEMHRAVTGKMLSVVSKKLDLMNAEDLTQSNLTEWVQTAIKADREAGLFADANSFGVSASRNSTLKQGELNFVQDFQGC
jgi:hypothetical protein